MNIEERKKEANKESVKPDQKVKEEKKSVSDLFMEELDDQEKEIFLQLKSTLIDKCELLEFEAVNEDNLDDFATLIAYAKNGVISIEDDGILVKLRRPITNANGEKLTDSVTILYEKNEVRENALTKNIKIKKNDISKQKEFSRACLASSFKDIIFNGTSKMLSIANTKFIHNKDYMLLLTCYNFFRN